MAIYQYENAGGLRFSHVDTREDSLIVESTKIPQTLDYIRAEGPVRLCLNEQLGFKQNNLDFLQGVEHLVVGLEIVARSLHLQGLERFRNLQHFHFYDEAAQPIAFECFPYLTYCAIKWNRQYSLATFPPSLTELVLWAYNPRYGFNSASLGHLHHVTRLTLLHFTGPDLSLLDVCGPLRQLEVTYGRQLTDISAVAAHAETLRRVDLGHCKKIADYSPLSHLHQLEWLNICDSHALSSVSFVQHLPTMRHFVFLGTTVQDGDLSPLHSIDYVRFNNKPHYSLKAEDFEGQ
ncbi:MAG: hypothetical protein EOO60_06190 [Hymenobacter sp.]|nr:MAG: hypothetical protein EOO60_06190 [Hymenobacter sp.]